MKALLLLPLAMLAGCGLLRPKPTPISADAPASCYVAAVPSVDPPDTGVRWDCDPKDPACWDDLAERVVPALVAIGLSAERSRQACAGFITDLKHRHVLTGKE